MGDVIINVFADGTKKWRLPPFLLVGALVGTALLRSPSGPQGASRWIHLLMVVAVMATGVRAFALLESERDRVLMTVLSFACVIAACVWTEYLRVHGEVDVTGRVEVTHARSVSDGGRIDLVIDGTPRRTHLRLTFAVEDADGRTQSCVPETRLDVALTGRGRPVVVERVVAGTPVDLALGGLRSGVSAALTLHTDAGCAMNVSVATAIVHD
ncbi:hypothetical protein B4N89_33665 [Embleya scabrispora]|uniref:Uncharacterized protein n=1 Tax=Embleya scabrispora TaxID=159449 RepID=A0A1T3NQE7_9ACTN|nr:hypothetical protein [Embleya scabrispora]OPC79049.1 hypothetical protein B4N89_33665 [Embleya scabrispora]